MESKIIRIILFIYYIILTEEAEITKYKLENINQIELIKCKTDSDCPENVYCNRLVNSGESYSESNVLPEGYCHFEYYCHERGNCWRNIHKPVQCLDDDDCPFFNTCNLKLETCENSLVFHFCNGKEIWPSCNSPINWYCYQNSDCFTGLCHDWQCKNNPLNTTYVCTENPSIGKIECKLPLEESCNTNEDCLSNVCTEKVCKPYTPENYKKITIILIISTTLAIALFGGLYYLIVYLNNTQIY